MRPECEARLLVEVAQQRRRLSVLILRPSQTFRDR
jgi:hypothetical protein